MKINSIQFNNLSYLKNNDIFNLTNIRKLKTDPNYFTVNNRYNNLIPGYIVKTIGRAVSTDPNVWIYFNHETMYRLFTTYQINNRKSGALVIYNPQSQTQIQFIELSEWYDTWPYFRFSDSFQISHVFTTEIDLDAFKSKQDIINFYIKNNLFEL